MKPCQPYLTLFEDERVDVVNCYQVQERIPLWSVHKEISSRFDYHKTPLPAVNFIIPTRELLQPIISVIFNKEPRPILSLMRHPASPFPSLPQSFSPHITSGYRCHVHLQQGFICLQRMKKVLNLQWNLRDRR